MRTVAMKKSLELDDFAARIVPCYEEYLKDELVSVVLFGSRARGEAQPASDYDLLIVAEHLPEGPLERTRHIRRPLKGQFRERISIVAKTRAEIDRGFPPLYLDIGLDGIILFDRGFMTDRIDRIQAVIAEAGLNRVKEDGTYRWKWNNRPRSGWSIDWSGYRELQE